MSLKCPYCGGKAILRHQNYVYHKEYTPNAFMYVCENFPKCDSYVLCHNNTTRPMGRLANKNLRSLKSDAHNVFDLLWVNRLFKPNKSKKVNRELAYKWLASQLNLPLNKCHMGLFDEDTCIKVMKLCSGKVKEFNKSF